MKTALSLLCYLLISITVEATNQIPQQKYIVYLGDLPKNGASLLSLHTNLLQTALGRDNVMDLIIHSYKRSFNGFVAKLTKEEMTRLSEMDDVVSVFPNEKKELHTTRSWDFMGFSQQVNRALPVESDIIIGVLDSGIWPESDSFKDDGFGPPPAKWKGTCQSSANFTCNKKIIGAKYYRKNGWFNEFDVQSPRDSRGHGTHTASTAAGNIVSNASLFGAGRGIARGGVPSARIAVYKICWDDGCYDVDILAAFDDAIADGVDIISLSVGGRFPRDYFEDSIAIGAFHAMRKGILTSNSAGNNGPSLLSVSNYSPWSLSVAASTIDRKFSTKVQLGNNQVYEGVSINTFNNLTDFYPLVYAGNVKNRTLNISYLDPRYCTPGTLDAELLKGKIVFCELLSNGKAPFLAGAVGTLMRDSRYTDMASTFPLPAAHFGLTDGTTIFEYVNTTSNPIARIFKSNEGNDTFAPYVASFSSRGPNPITNHLLSPDISAPGVDILAAWSQTWLTTVEEDTRRSPYHIISGTSMACPHATATAAYVKSFHPSWTPGALKSALMTTAFPMSVDSNPEGELAYGAGHINPLKAVNPGLVYDIGELDYIEFLCGQGYADKLLRLITSDNSSSCSNVTKDAVWDLNLPSFGIGGVPFKPFNQSFTRTVTNVGNPSSTYKSKITAPQGLKIQVEPSELSFSSQGQKLSFVLKVEGVMARSRLSASLVWDNGVNQARSPIVVYPTS
ncbi:cucumisin-like [Impatiens glandulifera]|uniref:cucumisin-like n=1 Tax=Impatiens glandulifera TaxID=253017 RepID=UPI001FB0F826|nr:cucumisin-like [Impatiens glandulifera]